MRCKLYLYQSIYGDNNWKLHVYYKVVVIPIWAPAARRVWRGMDTEIGNIQFDKHTHTHRHRHGSAAAAAPTVSGINRANGTYTQSNFCRLFHFLACFAVRFFGWWHTEHGNNISSILNVNKFGFIDYAAHGCCTFAWRCSALCASSRKIASTTPDTIDEMNVNSLLWIRKRKRDRKEREKSNLCGSPSARNHIIYTCYQQLFERCWTAFKSALCSKVYAISNWLCVNCTKQTTIRMVNVRSRY